MQLLDDHLYRLFQLRKVKYQEMIEHARAPAELAKRVKEEGLAAASAAGTGDGLADT